VKIWDRYMSYAAALGLARTALRSLPMGAEDDKRAWSGYGGQWREVRVWYPRTKIAWGRSPIGAVLVGLAIAAAGFAALWLMLQLRSATDGASARDEVSHWVRLFATGGAVAGVAAGAWGMRTLVLGL